MSPHYWETKPHHFLRTTVSSGCGHTTSTSGCPSLPGLCSPIYWSSTCPLRLTYMLSLPLSASSSCYTCYLLSTSMTPTAPARGWFSIYIRLLSEKLLLNTGAPGPWTKSTVVNFCLPWPLASCISSFSSYCFHLVHGILTWDFCPNESSFFLFSSCCGLNVYVSSEIPRLKA